MDSRMTCETCGETGHTGNSCPITQEEAHFDGANNSNNSSFCPQHGWNSKPNLPFCQQQGMNFNNNFQPTLKDLVYGQKQINDNDKILESLAGQLEGINSVIKNQLSFNKMIETQVAQLASSCPNNNSGKLPEQLEVPPKESVSAVTTRTCKSTKEPPYPKDAGSWRKVVPASNTSAADEDQEEAEESNTTAAREETVDPPRTSREFHDTTALLFPE